MKKGLILAVCITQSLLLLSQIEKSTLEMQRAASEYRQIADTNTGQVPMERQQHGNLSTMVTCQMYPFICYVIEKVTN